MAGVDANNQEIHAISQQKLENTSSSEVSSEGRRMKILRNVMTKTIKSYTSNLKLMKSLSNVSSTHLEHLHSKTVSQLENNIQCELEQMYKEESLEILLNNLDKLIAEKPQTSQTDTWRPSGSVQHDVACHVAVLKREKLKALENTLNDFEAQNKLLQERVQKRESHLLRTRDKIVRVAEDFEQIVDAENDLLTPKNPRVG